LGASAPFFLYKNMDKTRALLDLCYKRGTLIGLKQAMVEVNKQELNLLKEITKIEEEIRELEKEDA
jgi:hypothetical protein|tara:strand:+ start:144 stop:341 length:198 start_codon:yes stop_codon:yes gene_type:complete